MIRAKRAAISQLLILSFVLCSPICSAVFGYQSQGEPFKLTATVQRVILDVSVRDVQGGYVTGLKKDSFRVAENGRPEPILQFDSVDSPVTVGLLVDNSGSMREKRPAVIMAGLAFAKESNPHDQFFVVNFNDVVKPGLPKDIPFSDDLQTLRAALYMGRAAGKTALYDAIDYGIEHLRKGVQRKKTLIVVSDGGDNASKAPASKMLKLIRGSEVTIYTIGLFTDDDDDRNPQVLQKIARVSGGMYFNPQMLDEIIPVFEKISKDIRNRYTISYEPDPKLDPTKYPERKIRVTVRAPGYKKLIVHTRPSYSFAGVSDLFAHRAEPKPVPQM